MSKMTMTYLGDLQLDITHELSGVQIKTDAPPDNQGKGRSFSPTDLMATSLGSCMATVMAIKARAEGIELDGMKLTVIKEMVNEPVRRVGRVRVSFEMPADLPEEKRDFLQNAACACPVCRSLHEHVDVVTEYHWA